MAKCELSITLDEPDRRFHAGDLISGTLKVRVDQDVQCNGLEVGTSWRTHGRGNVDSATIDSQTVFSGDWRAGQLLEYPFKVKAAGWPPTYRGHHINVDHYVDARAKIPWAFDPKASEVIDVVASETSESPSNDTTTNKIVGGCVAAFIFAILIFVGMAVVGAIFQNALAIGIVGTTGASIAGFMIIRRLMIRWILGTPHCEFESLVIVQFIY